MTIEPVSSRASLDVVLEMFEQQPDLTAVPIERDDAVVGVVERDVIEKKIRPLVFSFLLQRPVVIILKKVPITEAFTELFQLPK
ncbi:MAG: hypothetical protein MST05_03930 [Treponema sp.]|nr:hypothetical protein [Treponema sp.]